MNQKNVTQLTIIKDDEMTLQFKIEYLEAIRKRYYQAKKREKTKILNELCTVAGYNRKYAIRILAVKHYVLS